MLAKINSVFCHLGSITMETDLGNSWTGKEFWLSKLSTISLPLMWKQSWLEVFNPSWCTAHSYGFSKTEIQQHLTFALSYLSSHEPARRVKRSGWPPGHIPTQHWSCKDSPCQSNWHVFECLRLLAKNSSPTLPWTCKHVRLCIKHVALHLQVIPAFFKCSFVYICY